MVLPPPKPVATKHHAEVGVPVLPIWHVPNFLLKFQGVITKLLTNRELLMREHATLPLLVQHQMRTRGEPPLLHRLLVTPPCVFVLWMNSLGVVENPVPFGCV